MAIFQLSNSTNKSQIEQRCDRAQAIHRMAGPYQCDRPSVLMGSAVVGVGSQASELQIFSAAELQIKPQDRSKAFKDSCRRVNRCTEGYCPGKASLGPRT